MNKACRSLLLVKRKKVNNIRQCHGKKGNHKQGMWNLNETIKYINFIKKNFIKFETEESRRTSRIFCLMTREIRSRSSVQCRSHHQKMVHTYGEVPFIISHYENNVIPYYKSQLEKPVAKIIPPTVYEPIITKQSDSCFRF